VKRLLIFLVFFCAIGICEAKEINIVTSFYPAYITTINITKNVPGISVTNLTPPLTGCLHDYSLTSGDMKKLADADILIINGLGMESFLSKIIDSNPHLKIVELSQGIIGDNPHVWVSISKAIIQARNLGIAMEELDPMNRELYARNSADYIAKLEILRNEMHSELASYRGKSIITFHEAFPYFAEEFGLRIAAVIEREPGTQPNAKELADTINLINRNAIKAIFIEPQYPSTSAETIARETKAKVYVLDPAVTGPDDPNAYIEIMKKNLRVLKEALK